MPQRRDTDSPSGARSASREQGSPSDTLVIGALYGELTPAEQAGLAAHLEAHPGDQKLIDRLQATRTAVRDSAVLDRHVEPPQAISALLLQEAARRAPKPIAAGDNPSWFAKLLSALVAHPALASVASLVIVVGVASTLYRKKGGESLAEQTVAQSTAAPESELRVGGEGRGPEGAAPAERAVPAAEPAAPATAQPMPADSVRDSVAAELDEYAAAGKGAAKAEAPSKTRRADMGAYNTGSYKMAAKPKSAVPPAPPAAAPSVTKADASRAEKKMSDRADMEAALDDGAKDHPSQAIAPTELQRKEAPRGRGFATAPAPAIAQGAAGAANSEDSAVTAESSPWARDTHQRVAALVRAGRCDAAAALVAQLKSRSPEYYDNHVATDRSVRSCLAYLAAAKSRSSDVPGRSQTNDGNAAKKAGAAASEESQEKR